MVNGSCHQFFSCSAFPQYQNSARAFGNLRQDTEKIMTVHADGVRSLISQEIFGGLAEEGDLPLSLRVIQGVRPGAGLCFAHLLANFL
jgi:hypothetical protein